VKPEGVVALLEALHTSEETLDVWGTAVVKAARPVLSEGLGVAFWSADLEKGTVLAACSENDAGEPYGEGFDRYRDQATQLVAMQAIDALFPDAMRVTLISEQMRRVGWMEHSDSFNEWSRASLNAFRFLGASDAVGLTSRPTPGVGVALAVPQRVRRVLGRAERARLTELSLHVEAAVRVRVAPEVVLGAVTPTGRLELRGELPRTTREALKEEVRGIERARTQRRRKDGEAALSVWKALAAGFISLVEQVERGGQRHYLLCESPPRQQRFRELTREEAIVSLQAARGLTNKMIAYSLGWTESLTARRLSRAATKLGLNSPQALARLLAGLGVAGRAERAVDLASLSAAEREVAALLVEGLTNDQIAARRGVAVRTVANQVASLLRKTGAEGRRAFAVVVGDRSGPLLGA
jgi:DNA-binding NarL/FixJ family response regulator